MAKRRKEAKSKATVPPAAGPQSVTHPSSAMIVVRVIPRSSKIGITQEAPDVFKVRLTAPPVDGAANAQLLKILSEKLSLPARNIQLISGESGRLKRLLILGLEPGQVCERLSES